MKAKTKVKTNSIIHNHNETRVRDAAQARGLKVKTGLKAGSITHWKPSGGGEPTG